MKIYQLVFILILAACVKPETPQSAGSGASRQDSTGSNFADSKGQSGQVVSSDEDPSISRYLELVASIASNRESLDREKDRRGKLMAELMSEIRGGCMYETLVKNIEIYVDGEKLGKVDVTKERENDQYPPEFVDDISNFEIQLGDMAATNVLTFKNNEYENQLFAANGKIAPAIPADKTFKIGAIDRIKIRKNPYYQIITACAEGKAAGGCGKPKSVYEVERYQMHSLKIKVNQMVVYNKTGINHTFSRSTGGAASASLTWEDNQAQLNPAFVAVLQNNECQ